MGIGIRKSEFSTKTQFLSFVKEEKNFFGPVFSSNLFNISFINKAFKFKMRKDVFSLTCRKFFVLLIHF